MSESPKSSLTEALKPITDEIIAYANDKRRCYAIGLEGEWGSGKTRYLEEIARPALKKEGFSMVRVSLFGVDSPDALYEKIGSSIFHLDDENSKGKKITREIIGQLPGVLKNRLSSFGVNISLNTSMKTFVDLVLKKDKHILVFDDLERRQSDSGDLSLFGAINDLVENREFKAIVVSSSIRDKTDNQGKSLDANTREKIIWKVLDFSPDPSALASEILDISKTDDAVFDVTEIVGAAAKAANCRNARALMKAGGFIKQLCDSKFVRDDGLAEDGRKQTLLDAVTFSLLVCMGKEPKLSSDYESGRGITPDLYQYVRQKEMYEKYCDLPIVSSALESIAPIPEEEIDACLREYASRRYPNSPDTAELDKVIHQFNGIGQMKDADVEALLPVFCSVVRRKRFSPRLLDDVVKFNVHLREVGFAELLSDEELLSCGKAVLDADPETGLIAFREETLRFGVPDTSWKALLMELCEHAQNTYREHLNSSIKLAVDPEKDTCGTELANLLEKIRSRNLSLITAASPTEIAIAFRYSGPESQDALRSFFVHLSSYLPSNRQEAGPYIEWLKKLYTEVESLQMNEKLDVMRKSWFLSNISDLINAQRS